MSVQNPRAAARHDLRDLFHSLERLERRLGEDPDLLRLREDAEQLASSLGLPPGSAPGQPHEVPPGAAAMPDDAPYDPVLEPSGGEAPPEDPDRHAS
ncbi:hypothetical protein ACFW9F_13720 [Streptomyces sp. NPDC059506]|uniref:hypothetical protein n=1 Tax=Streptomyces sp. NPDC059506 TaxID=3347751 RepID=UPI0036C9FFE3